MSAAKSSPLAALTFERTVADNLNRDVRICQPHAFDFQAHKFDITLLQSARHSQTVLFGQLNGLCPQDSVANAKETPERREHALVMNLSSGKSINHGTVIKYLAEARGVVYIPLLIKMPSRQELPTKADNALESVALM